jgi:hypothetical protein
MQNLSPFLAKESAHLMKSPRPVSPVTYQPEGRIPFLDSVRVICQAREK